MSADNPYKPPREDSRATTPHYLDSPERSLSWVLFSFQGRIPRRVYWGVTLSANFASYAAALVATVVSSEESLLELPRLHTVWLGGTKVSDTGLNRLAAVPTLKEIHVANAEVTADGLRNFRQLRPDCDVDM